MKLGAGHLDSDFLLQEKYELVWLDENTTKLRHYCYNAVKFYRFKFNNICVRWTRNKVVWDNVAESKNIKIMLGQKIYKKKRFTTNLQSIFNKRLQILALQFFCNSTASRCQERLLFCERSHFSICFCILEICVLFCLMLSDSTRLERFKSSKITF